VYSGWFTLGVPRIQTIASLEYQCAFAVSRELDSQPFNVLLNRPRRRTDNQCNLCVSLSLCDPVEHFAFAHSEAMSSEAAEIRFVWRLYELKMGDT
jgi:hypothetical protein